MWIVLRLMRAEKAQGSHKGHETAGDEEKSEAGRNAKQCTEGLDDPAAASGTANGEGELQVYNRLGYRDFMMR